MNESLRGHFRPEFLNRIDEKVIFDRLDREELGGTTHQSAREALGQIQAQILKGGEERLALLDSSGPLLFKSR